MSPVKALRSSWAATMALVLVMWAQVPHSKYVFESIITGGQDGWPFALGFEVAVLMFVVRSMHGASWFFAALSALINVKYYEMHKSPMWGGALSDIWGQWLLSLALPFVIAMYSHILAHVQGEEVGRLHLPAWVQLWRMKVAQKVAQWRQGKETLQPEPLQVASDVQEDATLSPTLQAPATEDASDVQPDPKQRAIQLRSEGFTLEQIAGMIGKSESTISRYVNGANKL